MSGGRAHFIGSITQEGPFPIPVPPWDDDTNDSMVDVANHIELDKIRHGREPTNTAIVEHRPSIRDEQLELERLRSRK